MQLSEASVVAQTRAWVQNVVVGLNFCPFAAKEVRLQTIRYQVLNADSLDGCFAGLKSEYAFLDAHPEVETTLLIFPDFLQQFDDYLHFLGIAQRRLARYGYAGTYQLASFHPDYRFAESTEDDPANFTNRSPFPMVHVLREATLSRLLPHYPNPEQIPVQNAALARKRGLEAMRALLLEARQAGEAKG